MDHQIQFSFQVTFQVTGWGLVAMRFMGFCERGYQFDVLAVYGISQRLDMISRVGSHWVGMAYWIMYSRGNLAVSGFQRADSQVF